MNCSFPINILKVLVVLSILVSCNDKVKPSAAESKEKIAITKTGEDSAVSLFVLGTVQDAGSPHIGCKKECCEGLFDNPDATRKVVSLGLIDHENKQTFLFEATPDFTAQVKLLKNSASWEAKELPDAIFLTHAHIGHYTGLMYLGKEAIDAKKMPVYAMPKMRGFLAQNGPWGQLVINENIRLEELENKKEVVLSKNLSVIPFTVPHRDEYSETVGYTIIGPQRKVLFIPDIDKWGKWETAIVEAVSKVDYAFLDAAFYDAQEINNRDISEIPHPFVIESMGLFENLPATERKKIHFIHFNHTNPLLNAESSQTKEVLKKGFNIVRMGRRLDL